MDLIYHDMIMAVGGQLLFLVMMVLVIMLGMGPIMDFNASAVRRAIQSLPSLRA
jgi:hypothetical protein